MWVSVIAALNDRPLYLALHSQCEPLHCMYSNFILCAATALVSSSQMQTKNESHPRWHLSAAPNGKKSQQEKHSLSTGTASLLSVGRQINDKFQRVWK